MPIQPEVLAALISGAVSLVIATASGLYVLRRASKRIDDLKAELIGTRKTERILNAAERYRVAFRAYEAEMNRLLAVNPKDATEVIQHVLDFFVASSREFYRENVAFLRAAKLDVLLDSIQRRLDAGDLNDIKAPGQFERIRALANDEIAFSRELYERSLDF
jgi:hypothetical protein